MSYQVLARKYRPKGFATVVGQEHVVRALTHALEQQRLHHAYLFTGTRGVGKTTLSRILAKSFNCETGVTANACGVCETCKAIDAGRFVDYIEMDAASNRGVDEMAQLLEQAVYAPTNARYKVYMIDEVHMLTNHAFNAMLKTLEEPPPHVKFILATTDPQKIPVTVLSRCLQFNLKQMPPGHIVGHLENILAQENIEFDTTALRLLGQAAQGSMRDALSLTDQAIAYAAGKVSLEAVQGMLGALDQSYLIRILDALTQQDGAAMLAVADEMARRSLSYKVALQDLGSLLNQVAVAQLAPAALSPDLPGREDVIRLAQDLDREEVQLYYQIAVHGRNELVLAPDEYAGFSMCLLRMLAFRPDRYPSERGKPTDAVGPSARSRALPAAVAAPVRQSVSVPPVGGAPVAASPVKSGTSPAMAALAAARAASGKKAPAPTVLAVEPKAEIKVVEVVPRESNPVSFASSAVDSPPWEEDCLPPAPDFPIEENVPVATDTTSPATVVSAPIVVTAVADLQWDGHWPNLALDLPVRGVAQQLAQQSELVRCEVLGQVAVFRLRLPLETLLSAGSVEKLSASLSERFARPVRIETEIGAVAQTANAQTLAERARRQQEAENAMQNDTFVQDLMREFGATIVAGSIKSLA